MIVGLTIVLIAISVYIFHDPQQWNMIFSWFWRNNAEKSTLPLQDGNGHTVHQSVSLDRSSSSPTSSASSTPKARPEKLQASVPVLSLDNNFTDSEDEEEDNLPPPQFPALNSVQRASSNVGAQFLNVAPARQNMGPPPTRKAEPGLMAPPSLPTGALRIPSTGSLPNRAPLSSNSSLLPLAAPPIPNPRKKVILSPGHSPLDWADLQRSSPNLSGVLKLIRVTPSMLKTQNGRKGKPAWSSYKGKVYNLTPYLPFHPGGEGEIRRAAGKDGEKLFLEIHPWVNWDNMLGQCLVGILVSENDPLANRHEMDDID
jgi:cytochrome b involved in lipid metabolism